MLVLILNFILTQILSAHVACTVLMLHFCVANLFVNISCKRKDGQKLADSWGVPYIECSSKNGESVAEVFHTLMKEIEKDDGLLAEKDDGGCAIM